MGCPKLIQFINIAEAARIELRQNHNEVANADQLASSGWERALRTAIFTAEIDAAYHKAKCPQCQGLMKVQANADQVDQLAA